jgi:riboflavin kinase / FMN adenylyltransferase
LNIHYHTYQSNAHKPVITIGAFDGVHLGHLEILNRLKQIAGKENGETMVVTFWPHPRHVLHGDQSLKLLNTLEEKKQLLEKSGIDHLVVLPFTPEFSRLSSYDFIRKYMVEMLRVHHFLLGYNHHLGKDREGNYDMISRYAKEFGFGITQVEPQLVDSEKVSSTKIRSALAEGNVSLANKYLGYNYPLTGIVSKGKQLGRKIGFPTANIEINESYKLVPKDGVYAVWVYISGKTHKGMLNIGYRPTVDPAIHTKTMEVHILDFEEDIYDRSITVEFIGRIRDEIKFPGLEALKNQLAQDKKAVSEILSVK